MKRRGPGFDVHRELDGGWACRAWDGEGRQVEVHQKPSREVAIEHALRDLRATYRVTA